jgi:hypothetical protein
MSDWGSAVKSKTPVTCERVTLQYCSDEVLDCVGRNESWPATPEQDLHALVRTAFHLHNPLRFYQMHATPTPQQVKAFWASQLRSDPWAKMVACASACDYKSLRTLL